MFKLKPPKMPESYGEYLDRQEAMELAVQSSSGSYTDEMLISRADAILKFLRTRSK